MKLAIVVGLGLLAATVGEAAAEDADTSEAQRLFEEGRALLEGGHTDAACDKFELSIAKDPRALGTLLNLGLCNERRGKVATALKLFQEAFDRAGDANLPQYREAAQQHIALLIPQIPVLVVKVVGRIEGESVFVDDNGIRLDKDAKELQLDPGPHKVVATAPGRLPFETTVTLAVGNRKSVEIAPLEVPNAVVEHSSSRRLLGKIATFSGGGLALAASAMSLYAYRTYNQQFDGGVMAHCQTIEGQRLCDDHGQDATTRARNVATGATVVGAVGLTALAGGVLLWLTAPAESRPTVVPSATATSASLSIVGRF